MTFPYNRRYINPNNDFGFKKIFGNENNKEILIDFLNGLLPQKHQIKELEFNDKEQFSDSPLERKAYFDIFCTAENGERFIVEMQQAEMNNFKERALYYTSFPIREQAEKGKWDFALAPVYFIGILNFELADSNEFIERVCLRNEHNQVFYDKLNFIYLQMPKFNKTESELVTHTDKWAYVLKNMKDLNSIPALLNEPVFKRAFEIAEFVNMPPQEQEKYTLREVEIAGYQESIQFAAQSSAKKRDLEIARRMKEKGIDNSLIVEMTGLNEAELTAL